MAEFVAKRKRLLTRSVLKMTEEITRYVKIEMAMFIGKTIKEKVKEGTDKKQKEPATLINVIDLVSGEPMVIVANTVLKSVLNEEYPDNAYVGKCFAITKKAKAVGKDYNPFNIEEIDDPNEQAATDASSGASASASPASSSAQKRK